MDFLKPMTGYLGDVDNLPEGNWIVEEKLDGHRMSLEVRIGHNILRTRTGKNVSDNLPKLRDIPLWEIGLTGTIFDGELKAASGKFIDLQSIIGSLPEKAIQFQEQHGYPTLNVFDMPISQGYDIRWRPLTHRKQILELALDKVELLSIIKIVPYKSLRRSSFKKLLEETWANGKEGLILKNLDAPYQCKKTKDMLKFKEERTFDVVIIGYQPPTKEYKGKNVNTWDYWETEDGRLHLTHESFLESEYQGVPVTKPYILGWIGAIDCGVWKNGKLVKVTEVKGITDSDQAEIRRHKKELIGTCIEIKAQEIISMETGSLRHPRFSRWHDDKDPNECTFENYIEF